MKRARLAATARAARRDYLHYERRTAARHTARVAQHRYYVAQRNLAAAVCRGTKDLASALPPEARKAVTAALRLTRSPTRGALGTAAGRLIPSTAATAALAFGASALSFALKPTPLTAAKSAGAAARALRELGRGGDGDHGR